MSDRPEFVEFALASKPDGREEYEVTGTCWLNPVLVRGIRTMVDHPELTIIDLGDEAEYVVSCKTADVVMRMAGFAP